MLNTDGKRFLSLSVVNADVRVMLQRMRENAGGGMCAVPLMYYFPE